MARSLDEGGGTTCSQRGQIRVNRAVSRRDGSLAAEQVGQVMAAVEAGFAGREHHLPSDRVFPVTERYRLSAYDAKFIALAEILGVPLVTEDRAILKCWPGQAFSLETALDIH